MSCVIQNNDNVFTAQLSGIQNLVLTKYFIAKWFRTHHAIYTIMDGCLQHHRWQTIHFWFEIQEKTASGAVELAIHTINMKCSDPYYSTCKWRSVKASLKQQIQTQGYIVCTYVWPQCFRCRSASLLCCVERQKILCPNRAEALNPLPIFTMICHAWRIIRSSPQIQLFEKTLEHLAVLKNMVSQKPLTRCG